MDLIGIKKSFWQEIFRLIDKKEKIGQENYEKGLKELGLDSLAIKDLDLALKDRDFSKESASLTEIFLPQRLRLCLLGSICAFYCSRF